MVYSFFILLGLWIISCAVGAWYLNGLRKKVARLYGAGETAGDDSHAEIIRRLGRLEAELEGFEPRVRQTENMGRASLQKIGFVRFNPFQDTGGDNSFVLVLLDSENNGVMVSSLFTREGVRVYGKAVDQGRSKHQLSHEEKAALDDTVKR
jgi:hypothetical protein